MTSPPNPSPSFFTAYAFSLIFLFEFIPHDIQVQEAIATSGGLTGALPRVLLIVVCVLHTSVAMGGERPGICSPIHLVVFASTCPSVCICLVHRTQDMSTCRCRYACVLVPITFGFSQLMFTRQTHIEPIVGIGSVSKGVHEPIPPTYRRWRMLDTSIQICDIDVWLTETSKQ
jgi:hypothetical protein